MVYMNKQSAVYFLSVLVLLGIIVCILTIKIIPPSNQYKSYVISGRIEPAEKVVGDKPQYVNVYYPYYAPKYLCRSSDIQISSINWFNDTTGEYQIQIAVPVGLKEVVITTDCSSCDHKTILLKESLDSVNLLWGDKKCESDFQLSEQQPQVVESARNLLNIIETNNVDKPFNSSEIQSIKTDLKAGRDEIGESDMVMNNVNDSLLHAYYASWFAGRARYKSLLFELEYCVNEVGTLLREHESDKCFVPDYTAYTDYKSANSSPFLKGSILLGDSPFNTKDLDKIKDETRYVYDYAAHVSDSLQKCENSKTILNGTFEFQKPYCTARKIVFNAQYIIWAIIFVYVGILVEKGKKIWKR